jgi:OFA family oxalate/formate antiporter-like MFS transporter
LLGSILFNGDLIAQGNLPELFLFLIKKVYYPFKNANGTMNNTTLESRRWLIVGAAILMQLCLGTVYAWSVFQRPLMNTFGWSEISVQVTFMICIGTLGLAAAFGGALVDRKGPRFVATIGGVLVGLGTLLAGLAVHIGSIWLIYLGFGLIAGLGNGFCYVTPIATLIRWFPDKRGLVAGLAVMGFGAGGFFMAVIVPGMVHSVGIANTFYIWGVIFLVIITAAAQFYNDPPKDWLPVGFIPATSSMLTTNSVVFEDAVQTRQWWMLWGMLFLNISAGLGLISQLSPMIQDVIKKIYESTPPSELSIAGGRILAYASIFNGMGRLFWAWLSDLIGRRAVFIVMFISQAILYLYLPHVSSQWIFTILACYLLACFGGGFAVMPAFAADSFGPVHIGKIYGIMLSSWGTAAVVGPLVFAQIKGYALYVAAGMLLCGFALAFLYKLPEKKQHENDMDV